MIPPLHSPAKHSLAQPEVGSGMKGRGMGARAFDKRMGTYELNRGPPLIRVASASVRDGISAAAVVFAPEYDSEDIHQIQSHICSRDCAGSTSPDRLASAA